MPSAIRCAVNAMLVYCDPASEWWTRPALTGCPPRSRCHSAMSSASSTSRARLCRAAAQPTTARENTSTTNATYTVPASVATWVKSATQRRSGASAVKSRLSRSAARSCPGPVPGTVVRGALPRRTPRRPCSRISRSTVHRATRMPARFSASHILRAPYTSS
jgi:hypothetical protein